MNKQNIMTWIRVTLAVALLVCGIEYDRAFAIGPGDTPDYFATPNWANSPPLRKFVDTLPGLGPTNANNLGQYIPVAAPDTITYPGSDYYAIELREYSEQMHSDMPPTRLRGYVQVNNGTDAGGQNTIAPATIHYLGPLIIAQKDRPIRIKFTNKLPVGSAGDLFVPVDTTIMGSGEFEIDYDPETLEPIPMTSGTFKQNRATLHLHGGRTPWISDGTPHQWITPAGEVTEYPKGVSVQNVPDMPDPGDGSQTFYWTNQQSSRLMFYHDHAWGITRLNVYVGEAAGYLITDPAEQALVNSGLIPADQIPLVIQEKTFVDPATIINTDPTWAWGSQPWDGTTGAPMTPVKGDLWYPHVYMPAQNPFDMSGINAMGRWHYGPWFWPPTPLCYSAGGTDPLAVKPYCIDYAPVANPYYDPACDPDVTGWCQPPQMPGTPNPSWGAEAFLDTPVVNGTAYPTVTVDPKAYRLRILNAGNDRFLNLQMYQASTIIGSITVDNPGSGYTGVIGVAITGGGGRGATAEATTDPDTGAITDITLTSVGSGYTSLPTVIITGSGTGATATAVLYTAPTEVGMVPAALTPGFPTSWPTDGREGGVPDPATSGPAFIQIGTESGFLPAPVLLENQPVAWNLDPTMFNVGNVLQQADGGGTLLIGPAERVDVIVDFSQYAGKTLILYNDAPTAFPALDPHYDYYTGAPDRTDMGGAPAVLPGLGPNVRTIMQIKVTGSGGAAPVNDYNAATLTNLQNAFKSTGSVATGDYVPGVFAASQEPIIVGQRAYGLGAGGSSAYSTTFPNTWPYWGVSRISDNYLSFNTVDGNPATILMKPKAIQDEMGETFDAYGRMSAKLGLEVPFTNGQNQNFNVQNYVDPATEILNENEVQIWKITHNGVDTHPIHFHMFDVQLINRVGWDGFIRLPDPNELGWKDTIRIAPLEDTIVALRPATPKVPFGQPDSIRPLNPEAPLGSMMGFSQIDPLTGARTAPPTTNQFYDFGWEYVWHCHLLSHEENDMMRSIVFNVARELPAVPVLAAALTEANQVNLTWTDATPPNNPLTLGNPANEIGFRIERCTGAGCIDFAPLISALANATGYLDTTVAPVTTYRYYITAYNVAGDSLPSNIVTVVVPALALPNAPSGLVATASPLSSNPPTVTLRWTDNSGIESGFFIQRATNTSFTNGLTTFTVGGNVIAFTDTTVAPRTRYYYRVRAYNAAGNSAYSNTVQVTSSRWIPATPTNLMFVSSTNSSITISWTDNASNEQGFTIQRAPNVRNRPGAWATIATVGINTTTYTDNGLTSNTRYWYRIRAFNADGNSAYSNTTSGSTLP
ncbi:MAG: fibronectin type III domain-containing protein [Nitrospirae bacterium]|nr:fibronectin type III domain-containing protein [Nitrospirota bacterium]